MSQSMTDDLLKKITTALKKQAHDARETAGFNGEWGDGGASELLEQLEFYNAGYQRIVPKEWEEIIQTFDPDYQEYLRLKNKFNK